MNTTFYPDQIEEQDWTCEDEAWMQEVMEHREFERAQCQSMQDYQRARNARNGEQVRLLVAHPFKDDEWHIFGPTSDPGFYYLHCVSTWRTAQSWWLPAASYREVFEQVFHYSEFETYA